MKFSEGIYFLKVRICRSVIVEFEQVRKCRPLVPPVAPAVSEGAALVENVLLEGPLPSGAHTGAGGLAAGSGRCRGGCAPAPGWLAPFSQVSRCEKGSGVVPGQAMLEPWAKGSGCIPACRFLWLLNGELFFRTLK